MCCGWGLFLIRMKEGGEEGRGDEWGGKCDGNRTSSFSFWKELTEDGIDDKIGVVERAVEVVGEWDVEVSELG